MILQFTPDVKCNVTYIVSDGYRLTLSSGVNEIPDDDWSQIKSDPEVKKLIESGDIVPEGEKPAKPASTATPNKQKTGD